MMSEVSLRNHRKIEKLLLFRPWPLFSLKPCAQSGPQDCMKGNGEARQGENLGGGNTITRYIQIAFGQGKCLV